MVVAPMLRKEKIKIYVDDYWCIFTYCAMQHFGTHLDQGVLIRETINAPVKPNTSLYLRGKVGKLLVRDKIS